MAIQAQPPQQQGNVPLAVEARFLSQPCLLAPGCMEYGGKTFGCRRHPLPLVEVGALVHHTSLSALSALEVYPTHCLIAASRLRHAFFG